MCRSGQVLDGMFLMPQQLAGLPAIYNSPGFVYSALAEMPTLQNKKE